MKNIFNHKHLLGAKVNVNGVNGFISKLKPLVAYAYSVHVATEDGISSFTPDGRESKYDPPSLRFGHTKDNEFDYGTPPEKPKEPLLELNPVSIDCWVTNCSEKAVIREGDRQVHVVRKTCNNKFYVDSEGNWWEYAWRAVSSNSL